MNWNPDQWLSCRIERPPVFNPLVGLTMLTFAPAAGPKAIVEGCSKSTLLGSSLVVGSEVLWHPPSNRIMIDGWLVAPFSQLVKSPFSRILRGEPAG